MFDLQLIPHDVLAAIFEIGTHTYGIRFLSPLRLVCQTWNDIVITTPRFWGIVVIDKGRDPVQILTQISRAKHSPLSIIVRRTESVHEQALHMLAKLSNNWVHADIPTLMLRPGRWIDLHRTLETLSLRSSGSSRDSQAREFFDTKGAFFLAPPRLRSFAAHGLTESWLLPFLSPSITTFEFHPRAATKLLKIFTYLSKVPQVTYLLLHGVEPSDFNIPGDFQRPLHFPQLTTLEIDQTMYSVTILSELVAPALQTLIIKDSQVPSIRPSWWTPPPLRRPEFLPLGPFFIAWSQPQSLPIHLSSLTLSQCLEVSDVALLIRWLARLPHLTSLGLHDDAIARAAELPSSGEETNIFTALTSPEGAGTLAGWLCPSLTRLQLSMDLQITDLLLLTRARGSRSKSLGAKVPQSLLHFLDAPLCPSGSVEEIDELGELVDRAVCTCLGCQLDISV